MNKKILFFLMKENYIIIKDNNIKKINNNSYFNLKKSYIYIYKYVISENIFSKILIILN